MKCYEIRQCTPKEQESCYVWKNFSNNPLDFENVKCWIVKGAYQQDNKGQLAQCQKCKYYVMMNSGSGIVTKLDNDVAVITCEGVINNDRSKALEKTWETVKKAGKRFLLLNLTNVNNIYSCGLGVIIKIHKDMAAANGLLVVEGVHGYVLALFESTKLSRLLHLAADGAETKKFVDSFKKKEETAKAPVTPVAVEEKPKEPKKRPSCFVYWKNHNPKNATSCNECFRKIKPTEDPCWLVEGVIEGVSFQYVNEDCEGCPYFIEFGAQG